MARLKITCYVDTDDLEESEVDLDDNTGLSEEGYLAVVENLLGYDDIEIVKV